MRRQLSNAELEAYLDEALPPQEMSEIEALMRQDQKLLERLAALNGRRDAGAHSVGDIWRRHRLSCATREELGSYLLGALEEQQIGYIDFHVEVVGCRYCRANLEDLRRQQAEASDVTSSRRSRYFQSSAGYLRRQE